MIRTLFPRRIVQWLGPLFAAGIAAACVAAIVIVSGVYNLAATTPHPQYLSHILHYTFNRVVATQSAGLLAPADLNDPSRVAIGATHFAQVCANCHGAPGLGQSPIALAMTPRPPYLVEQIRDLNPAETFWVLKHGVKYSAMPGWPTQTRDDEIWSMVSFVQKLPHMDYNTYRTLAFGQAASARVPELPFGANPRWTTYYQHNSTIPQGDINAYRFPVSGPNEAAQLNDPLANCSRCHGAGGNGRAMGGFPNLTIQTPAYLRRELQEFATGNRHSAVMLTVAAQLSPAQMDAAAAFYAAQPLQRAASAGAMPDPALVALGRSVADGTNAVGSKGCNYCHNLQQKGQPVYPRLQGQDAHYIANQLYLFARGGRIEPGVYNPMTAIAHGLTDREKVAVAAYFATQNPVAAQPQAEGSSGYIGPKVDPANPAARVGL